MISARDSTRIVADFLPGKDRCSVVVIPGFWRARADPVMRRISARLNDAGLTVVTLDNRGHGDSGGTYGFNTFESDDVIRTLQTAAEMGLISTPAFLLGFSAGGAIALSTAAQGSELVRGLVLVSSVGDFKRVFPRPNPFRLHHQLSMRASLRPPRFWWHEASRRHALEDARRVEAPVLMIHARNDWLVHHSHSERIAERLPTRPELHIVDLVRAHAERMLDIEGAPWDEVFDFMAKR